MMIKWELLNKTNNFCILKIKNHRIKLWSLEGSRWNIDIYIDDQFWKKSIIYAESLTCAQEKALKEVNKMIKVFNGFLQEIEIGIMEAKNESNNSNNN